MNQDQSLIFLEFSVLSIAALLMLTLITGISLYFPSYDTVVFIVNHYTGPVSLGAVFAFLIVSLRVTWRVLLDLIVLFINISLICFIHFNLKLMAMLINQANYDLYLWQFDQQLITKFGIGQRLYDELGFFISAGEGFYHDVFVALFFIALLLAVKDKWLFECVMGIAFILILGGACYALFPAWGPFIYEHQAVSYPIQQDMQSFYQKFILTHGTSYKPSNFIMPIAAMPSLHVAHSAFFALMVWSRSRAWFSVFFVLCYYLAWSAVILKWHYSLDVIAGLFISISTWWLLKNIEITGLGQFRIRIRIILTILLVSLIFIYWFNGK